MQNNKERQPAPSHQSAEVPVKVEQPAQPTWQATFSKRLPHRIGQPLSSSGGGDGCSAP
ncbi:hypothetical protein D9M72_490270 [compost metagenome]